MRGTLQSNKDKEDYIPFQNYKKIFEKNETSLSENSNSSRGVENETSKSEWEKLTQYLQAQEESFGNFEFSESERMEIDETCDFETLKKRYTVLCKENRDLKLLLSKSINMKNVTLQGMKKMDEYIVELLREIELLKEDLSESRDGGRDNLVCMNEELNDRLINNDEVIRDLKMMIEDIKNTNRQSSNDYEARVRHLKKKVRDMKGKYEGLWLSIEEKNESINKLEDKVDDYYNSNVSKDENLARKMEEIGTMKAYIDKLEDESRRNTEKLNTISQGDMEEHLNKRVDHLISENSGLTKLLSEEKSVSFGLKREIKELKDELHSKEGEITFLREQSDSRSNITNESKDAFINEEGDVVHGLRDKIEELNLLLTDKEDHFNDAQKRIEELKSDLTEANSIIKKYKSSVMTLTENNVNLNNDNDSLTSLLSKNEDELKDIIIKNDNLTQRVEDYINENLELKTNLDEALRSILNMKSKLTSLLNDTPGSPNQETSNQTSKKRKIEHEENKNLKKRKLL